MSAAAETSFQRKKNKKMKPIPGGLFRCKYKFPIPDLKLNLFDWDRSGFKIIIHCIGAHIEVSILSWGPLIFVPSGFYRLSSAPTFKFIAGPSNFFEKPYFKISAATRMRKKSKNVKNRFMPWNIFFCSILKMLAIERKVSQRSRWPCSNGKKVGGMGLNPTKVRDKEKLIKANLLNKLVGVMLFVEHIVPFNFLIVQHTLSEWLFDNKLDHVQILWVQTVWITHLEVIIG